MSNVIFRVCKLMSEKIKKKIFIFFWVPYPVKYVVNIHTPSLLWSIKEFPNDSMLHIVSDRYLNSGAFEGYIEHHKADVDLIEKIRLVEKRFIDEKIFTDLDKQYKSNNLVWAHLLTKRFEPLEGKLNDIL